MQTAMMPQTRAGLDNIGTGEMTQMAGGGLLAFVGGGDTSNDGTYLPPAGFDPVSAAIDPMTADPEMLIRQRYIQGGKESDTAKAQREALEAGIKSREAQMGKDKWTMLGLNLMAQTGPFALTNFGNAGKETLDYISKQEGLTDADRKELLKLAVEQDKNRETREDQLLTNLNTVKANKDTKMYQIEALKIQRQAAADAKQVTNEAAASKLWSDTLAKNLLNARTNAARKMEDLSEPEAYRQAYEETYNALKSTPVFKHLKDLAAPEAAPPPPPPPPKEPGFVQKLKETFGGNKAVDFSQLPK
jgi:hypothetical protein